MLKQLYFLSFIILFISCNKSHNKGIIEDKKMDSIISSVENKNIPFQLKFFYSILHNNYDDLNVLSKGKLYLELGNLYSEKLRPKKTIGYYKKAIENFKKIDSKENLGKTYVNIGIVYNDIGDKKKSLNYIYKGIKIAKEINNQRIESRAYGELAHSYYLAGDFEKAIDFLNKVLIIQKKQKDTIGISGSYQNIGVLYAQKKENEKAYQYMLKALELDKKIKEQPSLATSYNNVGATAMRLEKNKDTILKYFYKSIEIQKKNGIPIVNEYINIGSIYLNNDEISKAEFYYNKALSNANNKSDSIAIYDKLINVALEKNDSEFMFDLFKKRDSLLIQQKEKEKIESIKILNENHRLNLNKINLEADKKIFEKNKYFYIFLIVSILILGLFLILYFNYKALKLQKESLILERKVLRSQLNPHFIFNSLTALQNTLIVGTPEQAISYISRFAKLIRKVFVYLNHKEVSLKQEIDLLREYVEMQNIRKDHKVSLSFDIDNKVDAANTMIPPLLLQPVVENSFEHGFSRLYADGEISVKVIKIKNQICFTIKDNGKPIIQNKESEREHALDILQKRLKLFNKKTKPNFEIIIKNEGTTVCFCIDFRLLNRY